MIIHLRNTFDNALRIQGSVTLDDDVKARAGDRAVEYTKEDLMQLFLKEWKKNKPKIEQLHHKDGRETVYSMDFVILHREQWRNLGNSIRHLITEVENGRRES